MTPAILAARRAGVACQVLEYRHDPAARSFGLEAARALGVESSTVFKTLVASLASGDLAVERSTGYVIGGISPLGQRRRLTTVVDESALTHAQIYVSGGRRGLEIALDPRDLVHLTNATLYRITR